MPEQEIIPPEKSLAVGSFSAKFKQALRVAAILGFLGWAGWCVQNFISLRGIVNLMASRINLYGAVLLCSFAVLLITVNTKRRTLWCILLPLLFLVGAIAVDRSTQNQSSIGKTGHSFGIVPGAAWLSPSPNQGIYWVVFQPVKSITLVHVLAFYTVTNTKSTPVMISNLSLEMLGSHDLWWPLTNLPTHYPLWAADLNHPTEVTAIFPPEGFLKEKVSNVEIASGQTVQGWMLCQMPKDFVGKDDKAPTIRLRIEDTAGDDEIEPEHAFRGSVLSSGLVGHALNNVDLSQYKVVTY